MSGIIDDLSPRFAPKPKGCDHDDCDAPVTYNDSYHALCEPHYEQALEAQHERWYSQ